MDKLLHRFKADYFKALAHPTRLAILECLREDERSVNELQVKLGTDQPTLSAQLARLRAGEIVETRKEGTTVYYRVRDQRIFLLLDIARDIFNDHLASRRALLARLQKESKMQ